MNGAQSGGFRRAIAFPLIAALLSSTVLTGCVTTQSERIGTETNDPCRAYRVALDSTGDHFAEDMLKGAAVGAAVGAVGGLLLGRDTRSTLIGAAAGAAAGAAGGYFTARQQQARDQAVLTRTVLSDVSRDNAEIDKTQQAFTQLTACRQDEARKVREARAAGRIDQAEAQARMATIARLHREDVMIARRISEKIDQRSQGFEYADEQINPKPYLALQAGPVRDRADATATQIAQLEPRRFYPGARAAEGWVRVTLPSGGTGFAMAADVAPESDAGAQAILAPPPVARPAPARPGQPAARPPAPQPAAAVPARPQVPQTVEQRDLQSATSSNLLKKASFRQQIEIAEANGSAFELTS